MFSRNIPRRNDDRITINKMSLGRTMHSRNIVRRNDSIITVSRMTFSKMPLGKPTFSVKILRINAA
jgi:hypothetical protein